MIALRFRLAAAMTALIVAAAPSFAQNRLVNPPHTVDDLLQLEGAARLLEGAKAENVQATADGSGVELASEALAGSLQLPPRPTRFPFNEALPSWNGWAPKSGGFRVYLRAFSQKRGGGETPWLEAGSWGKVPEAKESTSKVRFAGGSYDIDTLLLQNPADMIEVRIDLFRESAREPSPVFRLFSLAYTNSTGDRGLARRFGDRRNLQPGQGVRAVDVPSTISVNAPYHSQVVPRDKGRPKNEQWVGRICSPCTVNSALDAFGIRMETQDVAAELYDQKSRAFGTWHRAVQGGAQHGLRGYVRRFRNWEDVRDHLARGAVVIASIRFEPGEVADPLAVHGKRLNGTKGHLVVIKGLAPGGKAIVHDSASKDFGPDSVWSQDELAKAWFDKGGVAYVFTGKRAR